MNAIAEIAAATAAVWGAGRWASMGVARAIAWDAAREVAWAADEVDADILQAIRTLQLSAVALIKRMAALSEDAS